MTNREEVIDEFMSLLNSLNNSGLAIVIKMHYANGSCKCCAYSKNGGPCDSCSERRFNRIVCIKGIAKWLEE